jgi:putative FmdB family regulatory protein
MDKNAGWLRWEGGIVSFSDIPATHFVAFVNKCIFELGSCSARGLYFVPVMPIYEYYCRDCNAVYQFFSRTTSPKADPPCPKNGGHAVLERMMSGFAFPRGSKASSSAEGDVEGGGGGPDFDNSQVAAEMGRLMSQMGGVDENDPKAMGRLMRRMTEITGEGAKDPAMQEAIRRLEGGEDPERVEELMEGAFGDEGGNGGGSGGAYHDPGIYDM